MRRDRKARLMVKPHYTAFQKKKKRAKGAKKRANNLWKHAFAKYAPGLLFRRTERVPEL